MPFPSHAPLFDDPNDILWRVQVIKLLIMQSSPSSWHFPPLRSKYSSPQHPVLKHPPSVFYSLCQRNKNLNDWIKPVWFSGSETGVYSTYYFNASTKNATRMSHQSLCQAQMWPHQINLISQSKFLYWRNFAFQLLRSALSYLPPWRWVHRSGWRNTFFPQPTRPYRVATDQSHETEINNSENVYFNLQYSCISSASFVIYTFRIGLDAHLLQLLLTEHLNNKELFHCTEENYILSLH